MKSSGQYLVMCMKFKIWNVYFNCSDPKPVFHNTFKKSHRHKPQEKILTPQHEELIHFVSDCK